MIVKTATAIKSVNEIPSRHQRQSVMQSKNKLSIFQPSEHYAEHGIGNIAGLLACFAFFF